MAKQKLAYYQTEVDSGYKKEKGKSNKTIKFTHKKEIKPDPNDDIVKALLNFFLSNTSIEYLTNLNNDYSSFFGIDDLFDLDTKNNFVISGKICKWNFFSFNIEFGTLDHAKLAHATIKTKEQELKKVQTHAAISTFDDKFFLTIPPAGVKDFMVKILGLEERFFKKFRDAATVQRAVLNKTLSEIRFVPDSMKHLKEGIKEGVKDWVTGKVGYCAIDENDVIPLSLLTTDSIISNLNNNGIDKKTLNQVTDDWIYSDKGKGSFTTEQTWVTSHQLSLILCESLAQSKSQTPDTQIIELSPKGQAEVFYKTINTLLDSIKLEAVKYKNRELSYEDAILSSGHGVLLSSAPDSEGGASTSRQTSTGVSRGVG